MESDPIGLRGGINPFVYTHNNPVNKTDPLGLYWYDYDPGEYDEYDYFYDGIVSGNRSPEYYEQEEALRKVIIEESKRYGGCIARCALEFVGFDLAQRGVYQSAKQVVRSYAGKAVLEGADKVLKYYSAYGVVKCTVQCCE